MKKPFYLSLLAVTAAAGIVSCSKPNKADKTFTEAADPIVLSDQQLAAWNQAGDILNVAWGDPDIRTYAAVPYLCPAHNKQAALLLYNPLHDILYMPQFYPLTFPRYTCSALVRAPYRREFLL